MTQVGITALRITLGAIFFMHGWQKFVQFTIPDTQAFFVDVGVPAAEVFAPVVAVLEIAGGVALVIGLLTRPFAVILAGISLGAVVLAHFSAGFFVAGGGYEFTLLLAVAAGALALIGPGAVSVDHGLAPKVRFMRFLA
jgi:putative oxidoreductase